MHSLFHVLLFPGSPSPTSTPPLAPKEASPTPSGGGGGGGSPFTQRKREAETLQEAITATALPGDPPLLLGELLCYIGETSVDYLGQLGPVQIDKHVHVLIK